MNLSQVQSVYELEILRLRSLLFSKYSVGLLFYARNQLPYDIEILHFTRYSQVGFHFWIQFAAFFLHKSFINSFAEDTLLFLKYTYIAKML